MYQRYNTPEFEAKYTYTGNDLGSSLEDGKTRIRLWAPTAKTVLVQIYRGGTPGAEDLLFQIPMAPDVQGTWFAEFYQDLTGCYYTYLVDGSREACDPYAKSTGINGQRAMILDMAATDPAGWDQDTDPNAGKNITDAVIYELHIRDLSMDESSGITHRGKFLGLTETGTRTPAGTPTGLDHIRSLGITHLHLLPVFDYGFTDETLPLPQFNWGYDPENFNVPEGSYSTDPRDGAVRVREMKQMVKVLHDNGISVVMDVVYNHVYEGKDFCFHKIVPGYFSRIRNDGTWSNGSVCGNDTASERSMVRKYIVDSVNYWADEYHIDGFRFDLVGLIDIETIRQIQETVRKKHPNVIFYGEGWSMDTDLVKPGIQLAVQHNSGKLPGFAFFSDTIRDSLRGSVFFQDEPGFVSGGLVEKELLEKCFMGIPDWAAEPSQSVNYVSCHDNNTLWDRICLAVPDASADTKTQMNNLAAAFSILSQGVPFFQAGEEMLRTKPGKDGGFDHNSYRASDSINAMKWSDLDTARVRKVLEYYQGLIAFRKVHPGLRQSTRQQVLSRVKPLTVADPQVVAFHIDEGKQEILAIFNAADHTVCLPLPAGVWDVNIYRDTAGTDVLAHAEKVIHAAPISATVLTRKK